MVRSRAVTQTQCVFLFGVGLVLLSIGLTAQADFVRGVGVGMQLGALLLGEWK